MAGKLTGNAIEDGTIVSSLLDSELSNSVGFIKVSSIVYPSGSSVSTAGNDVIELVGSGFDSNANVYINYALVSNITVTNSSSISVTTPAQNAGIYLLQVKNPNGESIDVVPGIEYGEPAYTFQGTVSGYTSGGQSPANSNIIDKFPFASDANATDVGDLSQARTGNAGQSSSADGYTSGGAIPSRVNTIDKFPFASDANATDVGDLTETKSLGAGQSSSTNGYTSGGSIPSIVNTIDKFPFASDANATDVGDLTQVRFGPAGQSSTTNGYSSGGGVPPYSNVIDKFPFATDANATDVGDLARARETIAGQSSDVSGYASGGFTDTPPFGTPPTYYKLIVEKFSFASDGNAVSIGNLTLGGSAIAGQSSTVNGYSSGGFGSQFPTNYSNVIDKFPFASDANATDVGDLTQARSRSAGQQV